MNTSKSEWRLISTALVGVVIALGTIGLVDATGEPMPKLREAVDAAYARHPQRQALVAHENEVNALSRRASSLIAGPPSLDAIYKTDQLGSDDGFREWEAGVSLPLWKPGQRRAATSVADKAAIVAESRSQSLLLTVAGEVRERMWEAELMQNNLELAKKEWDTAIALEHSVRRRVELGELARTDLLLASDSGLSKRASYLRAQKEFRNALQRYKSYTGMDRLPRQLSEKRAELKTIPESHPRLVETAAMVREAQARVSARRRAGTGVPELFVGGNGERGQAGEDFNTRLGIGISIPFGGRAHSQPEIASAQRTLAETQAKYEALRRQLELVLSEAAQEVDSVEAEYELAQQQNQLAQNSLHLAQVAFNAGESSLLDLLRVQALAFAAARREKELTIIRQRAIARYNQVVGIIP